jgi:Fe-S oxidoreductase
LFYFGELVILSQEFLENQLNKIKELAFYCYGCNACDTVCPANYLNLFSPRKFIRKLLESDISNIDELVSKEPLYNCLTCQQCAVNCPMSKGEEGVQISDMMRELRTYGFEKQITNKQIQENATHNSVMQLLPKMQSEYDFMVNKIDFLKNDSSLKIAQTGEIAYFVGCAESLENLFYWNDVRYTDTARATIKLLNYAKIVPVVLENKCCGHDSYWIGDLPTTNKLAEFNVNTFKKAGVKTIIVSCGEGYRMWKHEYPKLVKGCNFEVKHISQYLLEKGIFKKMNPIDSSPVKVTYHDPCRLGRLSGVYDPPRQLLKSLRGVELVEMEHNKENAMCCGVGAFMSCNSSWKLLRQMRVKEAVDAGAEYLITTCPKCITHFTCFLKGLETKNENYVDNTSKKTHKKIIPQEDKELMNIKIMDLTTFVAMRTLGL